LLTVGGAYVHAATTAGFWSHFSGGRVCLGKAKATRKVCSSCRSYRHHLQRMVWCACGVHYCPDVAVAGESGFWLCPIPPFGLDRQLARLDEPSVVLPGGRLCAVLDAPCDASMEMVVDVPQDPSLTARD